MAKTGRGIFVKYRALIALFRSCMNLAPRFVVALVLAGSRFVPGRLGLLVRYLCVSRLAARCGENVVIHPSVYLLHLEGMSFGSNISIHPMCYLDGYGGITIGNDVSIAHGSSIISANHTWVDADTPIKYNPIVGEEVVIGDDVWIGCGVRILAGSQVRSRSVIAAGAVYIDKVGQTASLWGGVPGKLIKTVARNG